MSQTDSKEETIFEAAHQLGDPEKQAAYLDLACENDHALRQRIEHLLRAGRSAKDFFQKQGAMLPLLPAERVPAAPISEGPGTSIGRYKLLQQIGEGGCGVVYMAEQEEPVRRRVALKVIKLGMDTKQVIARFDAERQALAMMEHPNIAKVLDGGSTDAGRPFFVMELVRGVKITDYCDDNNLPTRERLDLFIQVCQAIQHAHHKGVIHRDIKPSNILVTINDGVPVPKVIDFGIAKATQGRLTDQTLFTAFEQFVGTPAYTSPEQAVMTSLDIDTRSDIYSLGVLLYELLTGQTPFNAQELLASGMDEMRRTIREKEPPRPSTRLSTMLEGELTTTAKRRHTEPMKLIHQVRGDLDWIVMRCLEKDRTRRYETANGLAKDVQRYLADEPVVARPPSRLYEFQKSVRRHKFGFAAAAAVTAALLIGLAVSTWLLVKEKAARERALAAEHTQSRLRERAETEASKSRQVADFLKKMLKGAGPSVALGRDATMLKEILDETAKTVSKDLTNQPEVEVELCLTLAATYHDLGLYKEMEGVARHSLQLARSRLGAENESVAQSLINLGDALQHLGTSQLALEESEKYGRDGVAMIRNLLGDQRFETANALSHLANVLTKQGKLGEAEPMQREALATYRNLFGSDNHPEIAKVLFDLAITLAPQVNRLAEAEDLIRQALTLQKELLGDGHPEVAKSLNSLGYLLLRQSKPVEAEVRCREALAVWGDLKANDRPEVVLCLKNLAAVLIEQENLPEAEARLREALAMRRRLSGNEDPDVVNMLYYLALVLSRQGRLGDAETEIRDALAIQKKRFGSESSEVAGAWFQLADMLQQQGKLAEAETSYGESLAIERQQSSHGHLAVAYSEYRLALVRKQQGKPEAEGLFREAVEHLDLYAFNQLAWQLVTGLDSKSRDGAWAVVLAEKAVASTSRTNHAFLGTLAAAYAEAGQFTNAVRVQQEAIALVQDEQWKQGYASRLDLYRANAPYREFPSQEVLRALRAQGRLAEAETRYREALQSLRARVPANDPRLDGPLVVFTQFLLDEQRFAEAELVARESLTNREQNIPDKWQRFHTCSVLGGILAKQQKYAEAEALLLSGYEGLKQREEKLTKAGRVCFKQSVARFVEFYEATGQSEIAAEWRQKLGEFDQNAK